MQVKIDLTGVDHLLQIRIKLTMQIAATGAQEIHVDRNRRSAFDRLAVAILRNQQSALVVDEQWRDLGLLQLVVCLFHG